MNYEFWKKAGVATGAIGTIAIASAVLAGDAKSTENTNNHFGSKHCVMQKMHEGRGTMKNEAVQTALKNRDFNAFVAAVTSEEVDSSKILETITADNFNRFVDMQEAMQNKDFEVAKTIANELGLQHSVMIQGKSNGKLMHTQEEREAIRAAAIASDYQAWFNLVAVDGELPEHFKTINVDNFARFSKMYQLMDDAKSIREGLGLEANQNGATGRGMGRGMHKGMGKSLK